MSEANIHLVLLWHMHQPFYKNLVTGQYHLPWVRLHALKDYYGMVAMLEEFPNIHVTFNLVPSLLLQLEDYAAGTAQEPMQQIAYKPAEQLPVPEQIFLLRYFSQANLEHLISRYPRYRELYERMRANDFVPERALPFFQTQDLRDLQVLSQLAWFDEIYLVEDPEVRSLADKGRSYTDADQKTLYKKQQQLLQSVVPAYRAAAEKGQIEISTSPFYHPILPLLCDTNVAAEAHPGLPLPRHRFRHPEDARLQLERGLELHQRIFGSAPRGLWPSEGSVSEEVLAICASLGFRWIASDQRVLGNSIGVSFYYDASGSLAHANRLYTPYRFSTPSGPISILFRDQEIADRIGFRYARLEPEAAARDFVSAVRQSALPLTQQKKAALVPVILDGENAWEYYRQNGRPFLRALYRMLSEDPQIECCTVSEALDRQGGVEPLPRLAPGSWINANFDIWIGSDEDNRAWDSLSEAWDWFAEKEKTATPESKSLALEELLIAEGSDWCWWYGPEHSSAQDAEFDALYRSHLSNIYRALGHRPPETLAQPIGRFRPSVISAPPEAAISAQMDGSVTNYFEWMGAGIYSASQRIASMHGSSLLLQEIYYGRNRDFFFLRMDFFEMSALNWNQLQLHIGLRGASCPAVIVNAVPSTLKTAWRFELYPEGKTEALPAALGQAVLGKILEIKLSLETLGVATEKPFDFRVTLWKDQLPQETFPLEGWLTVPVLIPE